MTPSDDLPVEQQYTEKPLFPAIGGEFIYSYARPSITTDVVVIHRDNPEPYVTEFYFLLIKRGDKTEACAGMWALPGGYMEIDETLKFGASRELFEETGITIPCTDLGLVGIYDAVNRDTRGRVLTVAYSTMVYERPEVKTQKGFEDEIDDYGWFTINKIIDTMFDLAFDHEQIIRDAYNKLGT